MSTQSQSAGPNTDLGERGVVTEALSPGQRREKERLAVLEAQIAQTCYELSRLRAEHRRIRGRLALLEVAGLASQLTPPDPE